MCYAIYEDNDEDGEVAFEGFLQTSIGLSPEVTSSVSVEAGLDALLQVSILGILRL